MLSTSYPLLETIVQYDKILCSVQHDSRTFNATRRQNNQEKDSKIGSSCCFCGVGGDGNLFADYDFVIC